jgi:TorA maturation chaperone TorD
MLKQETVQIGNDNFILTAYPALRGLKYQKHLAKVLLPAFAEMSGDAPQEQEQNKNFAQVLAKLAENIDQLDENVVKEMVITGATKNGVSISFDLEFQADYGRLFELVQHLVRFNFGSVFSELGSAGE